MHIDWSVSLGNLLSIAAMIVAALTFFLSLRADLLQLNRRMTSLEDASREQTHILVALAEQKTHIEALAKRIDDMHRYGSHRLAEILDNAMRGRHQGQD